MKFLTENLKKLSLTVTLMLVFCFFAGFSETVSAFVANSSIAESPHRSIFLMKTKKVAQAEGKRIDVSLASQTLTLFNDGKAVGSYKISSGKKSMPTPKGNFQVYNKTSRAWSAEYKLFMPYWMAFTPDGSHGIHELPEWPNGAKEGAAHLGIPVSHGCVRLGVGAARTVYNWAPVGTPVNIH